MNSAAYLYKFGKIGKCVCVCVEGEGEVTYVVFPPHTSLVGKEVKHRSVQLNKMPQTSLKQVGTTPWDF
jgi:hypothetical protein